MATLARGARRRARRARRLHAPADRAVPRPLPRAGSSTSTPRSLPAFPGAHAIDDALAAGVETTGRHRALRRRGLDTGPVILQEARARSSRARRSSERIHAVEHRLLPEVVSRACACRALITRLRQGRARRARARPRGARLGARLVGRHGDVPRASTASRVTQRRGGDGRARDARRPREDTPPAHPRRHPRAPRPRTRTSTRSPSKRSSRSTSSASTSTPSPRSPRGLTSTEAEIVEMIDVGGPSMLRAAAKNFAHVAAVSGRSNTTACSTSCATHGEHHRSRRGARSPPRRSRRRPPTRRRSRTGSATTSLPGAADADLPARSPTCRTARTRTRRPRTTASPARGGTCSRASSSSAARSSRTTTSPTSKARGASCASSTLPAVVIVKHANPCGVAVADDDRGGLGARARRRSRLGVRLRARPEPAGRRRARRADRRALRRGAARAGLRGRRARGARAPRRRCASSSTTSAAATRRRARFQARARRPAGAGPRLGRRGPRGMQVVAGAPDEEQWGDLLFAWRVCKHVSSNAIVLAKDLQTIGIGAGQMSRVDAVRIAVEKAREHGHDLAGAALACDAFFPFADGPQLALEAGVTAIIQPGGSTPRRRGDRRGRGRRRGHGLHRPPPLPALSTTPTVQRRACSTTIAWPPTPHRSRRARSSGPAR